MKSNKNGDELKDIPLEDIYWEDPTDVSEEQIKDMATSLKVHGQIEPIVVSVRNERGHRGIVGRLRYEGMKYLWRDEPEGRTILARVHRFDSEVGIKTWQLVENLHRREIPAMMRAQQLKNLYDLLKEEHSKKATVQLLASTIEDMTGNKQSIKTIQHYLGLTNLEPETQEILTSEKMPLRYGLELLRLKDPEKQVEAAKDIQKDPRYYTRVIDVQHKVETILEKERQGKHNERLKKKAEELRAGGKTVYVERLLSWNDREKYNRFWGDMPEGCKNCPKLGILLQANWQQISICTDLKCWKKKQQERTKRKREEEEARDRLYDEEKSKVYEMQPDIRHWQLAVYGLVDDWDLKRILGVERSDWKSTNERMWNKVLTLSQEECKKLLLRHAIEEILTGPQGWRGEDPAKEWTIKEFGLNRKLFIADQEDQEEPEE